MAILGDPACRPGWQNNLPRLATLLWNTYRPSHVFVPGDVTAHGTAPEHKEFLLFCRQHPWEWVVAMGDHDRPLDVFCQYWGPAHKVTDVAGWRFIGVDTSEGLFLEHEAQWLRQQVRSQAIVYMHMPPGMEGWEFHSLTPACTARFFDVLDAFPHQIHACFFGHIHSYDSKTYRGIPLVVTGAGGAETFGLGLNGYEGTRPSQAVAFDILTGEIHLIESE